MKPRTKKILLGLAAIIILANIASRVISFGFLQQTIEKKASEASGYDISISPEIHLGMKGIKPSFVLNDLSAKNPKSGMKIEAKVLEGAIPLSAKPDFFDLSVEKLVVDGRELGDYQIPLKRVGDGIDISNLTGQLYDARLKGPFSYHDGKLAASINVTDLDYKEFAKGMKSGKVNVDIDVKGHGENANALIRSLNGSALLSGGEGSMTGDAVNLWASNLIMTMLSTVKGGSDTKILCTIADFKIENGIARSKAIIVDTEHVAIFGRGQIDLAAGRMDMVFTPKPKEENILSLATPIRVAGPIENPRVAPDTGGAIKKFGGLFLSAINPAMALLPMFEKGNDIQRPCAAYLEKREK